LAQVLNPLRYYLVSSCPVWGWSFLAIYFFNAIGLRDGCKDSRQWKAFPSTSVITFQLKIIVCTSKSHSLTRAHGPNASSGTVTSTRVVGVRARAKARTSASPLSSFPHCSLAFVDRLLLTSHLCSPTLPPTPAPRSAQVLPRAKETTMLRASTRPRPTVTSMRSCTAT
jgi:hypothetical protein